MTSGEHPIELNLRQLRQSYAELRIIEQKRLAQLSRSLKRHGQQSPVLVVAGEEADRYVLIDGYLRVMALDQLGRDTVRALPLRLCERQALVLCHRAEPVWRRTELEQGWLVRLLSDRHNEGIDKIARDLGQSSSWVQRRLTLVRQLPESEQDLVRQGILSPYAAVRHCPATLSRKNNAGFQGGSAGRPLPPPAP